jgi:hypothetical protein
MNKKELLKVILIYISKGNYNICPLKEHKVALKLFIKMVFEAGHRWLMSVILAT